MGNCGQFVKHLTQVIRGKKEKKSGGYSWEFLVGVCRPVLQILTLFQTKKCHFPHPFSDQTSKTIPGFRPGF